MKKYAHKIGAGFYVLWGILHIGFGATMLYKLSAEGGTGVLAVVGTAIPLGDLPQSLTGIENGLLGHHSWNILWFGIFAIVVGIILNWKNDRTGYWVNLSVVGLSDLGFIVAIMIPGYIALADGIMGPILWILAFIFSTIGVLNSEEQNG